MEVGLVMMAGHDFAMFLMNEGCIGIGTCAGYLGLSK